MTIQFQKATKQQAKLRLGLVGPSGSGKTFTALALASGLGKRIAVVDTEHGSARLYSDKFGFDVVELDSFNPQNYIDAVEAAALAGYDIIVLDSLSHAWTGKDGALELKDEATARSRSKNAFTDGWREVTPLHNKLIESIVSAPIHVIATMRAKTEYVVEQDERGRSIPRKIGLAPVQRAGMEYEFTVVADLDYDHNFVVSKTRCDALDGKVFKKAGADVAKVLIDWLNDGEVIPLANKDQLATIETLAADIANVSEHSAETILGRIGSLANLTEAQAVETLEKLGAWKTTLTAEKNGQAEKKEAVTA